MIRNKTEERKRRLSTKTLDQTFRKEVEKVDWNKLLRKADFVEFFTC